MTEPNLAEEFKFLWFRHIHRPGDTEEGLDDICSRIALPTQRHNDVNPVLALAIHRTTNRVRKGSGMKSLLEPLKNSFDFQRVRLVTNFEDIGSRDMTKTRHCRLQSIQSISHIAFSCEDNCFQPREVIRYGLERADLLEARENLHQLELLQRERRQDLRILEFGVSQHSASTLNWFNNLCALIASQCKSCGGRVNLHSSNPQ